MTIAVFDLTEHTQMSIRGTTGTHPNSKYVFGIHIGTDEVHAEQLGLTPDITAYDDTDWSKAVELANWITENTSIKEFKRNWLTKNCALGRVWDDIEREFVCNVIILVPLSKTPIRGGIEDRCEWERAVQMAKWILEWDERFKEVKE